MKEIEVRKNQLVDSQKKNFNSISNAFSFQ